eukprot:jgi/Bigna1/83711/fgenesh1_pg.113_\
MAEPQRMGTRLIAVKCYGRIGFSQVLDHPALVLFSLIGNDVCNGHPGTTHMTPPEKFLTSVKESLAELDKILPNGSFVVMQGLVDGRVLWDTMHAQTHPLGPKYHEVYDFLACEGISCASMILD